MERSSPTMQSRGNAATPQKVAHDPADMDHSPTPELVLMPPSSARHSSQRFTASSMAPWGPALKYWLILTFLGFVCTLEFGFPGGIRALLQLTKTEAKPGLQFYPKDATKAAAPGTKATAAARARAEPLPWWLTPNPHLYQILAHSEPFPVHSPEVQDSSIACLRGVFSTGVRPDAKVYAQFGEDGILERIFKCIGTTSKTYVEFGAQTGQECSTRWLREGHGFSGLLLDGGFENSAINLRKEKIYAENIADLLHKHKATFPSPDHMTIDLDLNTFHVAAAVLKAGWRPRSLTLEFNRNFMPHQSYATVYDKEGEWLKTGDCYFGASALAYQRLAGHYGYQLIAADYPGVNLFFVHKSALGDGKQQVHEKTDLQHDPLQQVYMAIHKPCPGYTWVEVPENAEFSSDWSADNERQTVLNHGSRQEFYRVMYEPKGSKVVEEEEPKVSKVPAVKVEPKVEAKVKPSLWSSMFGGGAKKKEQQKAPAPPPPLAPPKDPQQQLVDAEWSRYTTGQYNLMKKQYHDSFLNSIAAVHNIGKPIAQLLGKRRASSRKARMAN